MQAPVSIDVQGELDAHGYCVVPFLPAEVAADLLARFERLDVPRSSPVHRTFIDSPRDLAREIDLALKRELLPYIQSIVPDNEPFLATYCYKGPGDPGLEYHQDWTFTDERQAPTTGFWIPLVDVDASNGGLAVIPGSHRWTSGIRPCAPEMESPIVPHQDRFAALVDSPKIRVGEAVVYDVRAIHGSPPNTSASGRPAIIALTAPSGADIVHFQATPDRVEGFVVDESFFATRQYESRPDSYVPMAPWTVTVAAADFDGPLVEAEECRNGPEAPTAPKRRWPLRLRRNA